jgi:hypothetical protein
VCGIHGRVISAQQAIMYIGKTIDHLPLFAKKNFETKILLFDVYVFRAAGSSRPGTD